jgi:predicted house-cleaning noncanonical NTP pyrophosphatase (MazG superfamily)
MNEASSIVAQVFWQAMSSLSLIAGAHRAAQVLLKEGSEVLFGEAVRSADLSLHVAQSFGVPPERLTREDVEKHIFGHQSKSLSAVIDASLLITMHALLDDALYQLLRAAMIATPEKCEHFVSSKKIDLAMAKDKNYAQLLADKLTEFERSLSRASLLEKVDHLLSVVRPEAGSLNTDVQTFSRERLEQLDNFRHDLVHGSGPREIPSIREDLEYLQYVLFTLWAKVALSAPGLVAGLLKGPPQRESQPQ